MKILFLTPQLPYPPTSGGVIKTYKMIEYLKGKYHIELAFFKKETSEDCFYDFLKIYPNIKIHTQYLSIPRTMVSYIKSLLFFLPISVYRNRSKVFSKAINEMSMSADVIFVDHFLMFQYVPKNYKGRVILHQHNAEHIMWKRYGENQDNIFLKLLTFFESWRIKKYEQFIMNRACSILASPNDIDNLKKLIPKTEKFIETFHLGDEKLLEKETLNFDETKKSLLYIGTLTWEANIDGLLYFLQNVWPEVVRQQADVVFNIVGKLKESNDFSSWRNDPRIIWHGYVEDLNIFYDSSRVFVAPLRFGSGIKVKVVNALYRGLPTVTTSIGIEGLELRNGEHIFYSENPKEQAAQILRLLQDKIFWKNMSDNSRLVSKEKYTWDSVFFNLEKALLYECQNAPPKDDAQIKTNF